MGLTAECVRGVGGQGVGGKTGDSRRKGESVCVCVCVCVCVRAHVCMNH